MNWGIMGTGKIVDRISVSLNIIGHNIYAISSMDKTRAKNAATKHNANTYYDSYESMLYDDNIDAVYIATPHPSHLKCALMALEKGIPVLCEKPLTMNANQAKIMVESARDNNTFLMEAMKTRHYPVMHQVMQWLEQKKIGNLNHMVASCGFYAEFDPSSRLFNKELGGGAFLDMGIYPVSFSSHVMGCQPDNISVVSTMAKTGVDIHTSLIFQYDNGTQGIYSCGFNNITDHSGMLGGEKGYIWIDNFRQPTKAKLIIGNDVTEYNNPPEGEGFEYEFLEVERCIKQGLKESPNMTLNESITIMETVDRIIEKMYEN